MGKSKTVLLGLFGLVLLSRPAWAWFNEGHEIVAVIAADELTPTARSHVAQILGVPDDTHSVEKAMAAASIRPDTEFREQDRTTAPWHYIDICLQDTKQDLAARCPQGNCVTAKIDDYARRLRDGNYDKWGAAGDLAFLIHFVGDIHQPLHAVTDADRGGTCQGERTCRPPFQRSLRRGARRPLGFDPAAALPHRARRRGRQSRPADKDPLVR